MERWDLYDRNRIRTGRTIERGNPIPEGLYRLVVQVCIFNAKGEMLIHRRVASENVDPNLWDISAGGGAATGESSQAAMERELLEELGYSIDFSEIRPHLTINFPKSFVDYYLIERDVDIESLAVQHEEVQAVKWASQAEVLRLIDGGEFVPIYRHLLELFFDMRKRYGAPYYSERT